MEITPTDIIVAAQLHHAIKVRSRARAVGAQVTTMTALLMPAFDVVWDPYGHEPAAYVSAFDKVDRVMARIAQLIAHQIPHSRSAVGARP